MILLLDNYDSFVFNLARYLEELGETVEVVRNDATDVAAIRRLAPTHLVISPGPCTPREAGIAVEAVRALAGEIPILGVCLGHQCIAEAYGGRVVRARTPMHGKLSRVRHGATGLFAGLPNPLTVTRYHSLVVDGAEPGEGVRATAWSEDGREDAGTAGAGARSGTRDGAGVRPGALDGPGAWPGARDEPASGSDGHLEPGEIMALEHVRHPVWGVQFHPEAVLTTAGHALLANFLALGRGEAADGLGGQGAPADLPREARDADAGPGRPTPGPGGPPSAPGSPASTPSGVRPRRTARGG